MPATEHLRSAAIAVAVTLSLAIGAGAQTPGTDHISIDNFARVSATYYRGAQPEGSDYAALAQLGVKTVINLIGDEDLDGREQRSVEAAGMRYVNIPMTTHKTPTPAQIDQFLSIVNGSASQPVYVHCVGGRHRTGVMTAVYRMTQDGWNADQAFAEMQKYKFGPAFLHSTLKDFVYDYYAHNDRRVVPPAVVATAVGSGLQRSLAVKQ